MAHSGVTGMERKTTVEAKQIEGRVVTGFPSVFGNVDDGGDLIEPGAYVKTLGERGERLRWLWQHDNSQPPTAKILAINEVGRGELPQAVMERFPEASGGLRVMREYLDTPRGNEVLAGLQAGAISEMSIGYDAIAAEYPKDKLQGGRPVRRVLKEIRLWEMSDVNWGMNAATANLKALLAQTSGRPEQVKALAEWFESRIHLSFTQVADELFGDGYVTREERIALSGLIGDALDAFNTGMQASPVLAGVRERERWEQPEDSTATPASAQDDMPDVEMMRRRVLVLRKRLALN